ncbi:uncharacterized protein LOC111392406 [Olea europaea var. sylvestris]|nr:uncharacterized protein LOC111392406 [Olea europaea var. sylvestris]
MGLMDSQVLVALGLSLLGGLSTSIGAFFVVINPTPNLKTLGVLQGFAAGLMLSISFLDLAHNAINSIGFLKGNLWFFAGVIFFAIIANFIPEPTLSPISDVKTRKKNEDERGKDMTKKHRRQVLFGGIITAIGISLHNFPEGMVVFLGSIKPQAVVQLHGLCLDVVAIPTVPLFLDHRWILIFREPTLLAAPWVLSFLPTTSGDDPMVGLNWEEYWEGGGLGLTFGNVLDGIREFLSGPLGLSTLNSAFTLAFSPLMKWPSNSRSGISDKGAVNVSNHCRLLPFYASVAIDTKRGLFLQNKSRPPPVFPPQKSMRHSPRVGSPSPIVTAEFPTSSLPSQRESFPFFPPIPLLDQTGRVTFLRFFIKCISMDVLKLKMHDVDFDLYHDMTFLLVLITYISWSSFFYDGACLEIILHSAFNGNFVWDIKIWENFQFGQFLKTKLYSHIRPAYYNESGNGDVNVSDLITHFTLLRNVCIMFAFLPDAWNFSNFQGVAVALPVYFATESKWQAFKLATLSGLAEPLGVIIVAYLFPSSLSPEILEGLLGSVGGVMAFLTLHEMLPLAFDYAGQKQAVKAVFFGMAFMSASLYFLEISLPEDLSL